MDQQPCWMCEQGLQHAHMLDQRKHKFRNALLRRLGRTGDLSRPKDTLERPQKTETKPAVINDKEARTRATGDVLAALGCEAFGFAARAALIMERRRWEEAELSGDGRQNTGNELVHEMRNGSSAGFDDGSETSTKKVDDGPKTDKDDDATETKLEMPPKGVDAESQTVALLARIEALEEQVKLLSASNSSDLSQDGQKGASTTVGTGRETKVEAATEDPSTSKAGSSAADTDTSKPPFIGEDDKKVGGDQDKKVGGDQVFTGDKQEDGGVKSKDVVEKSKDASEQSNDRGEKNKTAGGDRINNEVVDGGAKADKHTTDNALSQGEIHDTAGSSQREKIGSRNFLDIAVDEGRKRTLGGVLGRLKTVTRHL